MKFDITPKIFCLMDAKSEVLTNSAMDCSIIFFNQQPCNNAMAPIIAQTIPATNAKKETNPPCCCPFAGVCSFGELSLGVSSLGVSSETFCPHFWQKIESSAISAPQYLQNITQ